METKRQFIGRDIVVAQALAHVLGETKIDSVPVECLASYAREMTSPRYEYEDGNLVFADIMTDCEYDDKGNLVTQKSMADGIVASDGESVRLATGRSMSDLFGFLEDRRICWMQEDCGLIRHEHYGLMLDVLSHFLGAKAIDVEDVPKGKPLVLVDIDDCLNVASTSIGESAYSGFSHMEESYEIDMDQYLEFPEEIVGMHTSSGIPIPRETRVRWSSELAHDMSRLHEDVGATFVWLSSWMECSKCFERMVWPDGDSPFIGYRSWQLRGFSDDGRHGKALSLSDLLGNPIDAEERAELARIGAIDDSDGTASLDIDVPCIVVIDDKGCSGYGGHDVFESAVAGAVPELTISPDGRYGITKAEWRQVEEFLRHHSRQS